MQRETPVSGQRLPGSLQARRVLFTLRLALAAPTWSVRSRMFSLLLSGPGRAPGQDPATVRFLRRSAGIRGRLYTTCPGLHKLTDYRNARTEPRFKYRVSLFACLRSTRVRRAKTREFRRRRELSRPGWLDCFFERCQELCVRLRARQAVQNQLCRFAGV